MPQLWELFSFEMMVFYVLLIVIFLIVLLLIYSRSQPKNQLLETYYTSDCLGSKIAAQIAITPLSTNMSDSEKQEVIKKLWDAGCDVDKKRFEIKSIQITSTADPEGGILVFRATSKPFYDAFPPREQKYWVTYCPSGPMEAIQMNGTATIIVSRLKYPKGVDFRTYEEGPGHFLAPHTHLTPLATIKAK